MILLTDFNFINFFGRYGNSALVLEATKFKLLINSSVRVADTCQNMYPLQIPGIYDLSLLDIFLCAVN